MRIEDEKTLVEVRIETLRWLVSAIETLRATTTFRRLDERTQRGLRDAAAEAMVAILG